MNWPANGVDGGGCSGGGIRNGSGRGGGEGGDGDCGSSDGFLAGGGGYIFYSFFSSAVGQKLW